MKGFENLIKYVAKTDGLSPAELEVDTYLRKQGMDGLSALAQVMADTVERGNVRVGSDRIFDLTTFPGFYVSVKDGIWLINSALPDWAQSISLIGAACTQLGVPQDLISRLLQEIKPFFRDGRV